MGSILVSVLFGFVGLVLILILKDVHVSSDGIIGRLINWIVSLIIRILGTASFFGLIIGVAIGIFDVHGGYTNPEIISTVELVSLRDDVTSNSNSGLIYVTVSGTNTYTYYVEVDSEYASSDQKSYKSYTISSDNVTIVEDKKSNVAKLVTYEKHGKSDFWSFAVYSTVDEYVFYVPEGTIVQNISLADK